MAKKPYDVTKRFQEVAERARAIGPINTGPSTKKPQPEKPDTTAFPTRPGASMKKTSDVNLPINTGPRKKK